MICVSVAVIFSFFFAVGVKAVNFSSFDGLQGERVFYLDSASSQGLRKETLRLKDLHKVKGECVRVALKEGEDAKKVAKELIAEYNAEVLFEEQTGETVSYYAYTEKLNGGIFLYGQKINLHIAFSDEGLVVGTPIIFDGF